MPLEWLFGKKKTPQEILRQNQRALNKAMRDLDRERQRLEQQENKIKIDIKKMANQGQMVRYNHFKYTCDVSPMFIVHG
jgi:charged multivesicular body protein 2A